MSGMISKKNGLPIRCGVILVAGPDNPYFCCHEYLHVVKPEAGHCLDVHNNVMIINREEMESMWVAEWRSLPREDWWQECKNGLSEDELYMSGICAGCEDHRF